MFCRHMSQKATCSEHSNNKLRCTVALQAAWDSKEHLIVCAHLHQLWFSYALRSCAEQHVQRRKLQMHNRTSHVCGSRKACRRLQYNFWYQYTNHTWGIFLLTLNQSFTNKCYTALKKQKNLEWFRRTTEFSSSCLLFALGRKWFCLMNSSNNLEFIISPWEK